MEEDAVTVPDAEEYTDSMIVDEIPKKPKVIHDV